MSVTNGAAQSSQPHASAWRPRSWSLQTRIVAALAVTVIVLSAVIGGIGLSTLRASMLAQLDSELTLLGTRISLAVAPSGAPSDGGASGLARAFDGPGAVAGTIVVVSTPQGALGALLDDDATVQPLPADALSVIAQTWDGATFTDATVPSSGPYRFMVEQREAVTVIVGLPLAQVRQTMSTLGLTMGLVALGGGSLLAGIAAWYIRRELRPVARVAQAAEQVSRAPLATTSVALPTLEHAHPSAPVEVRRLLDGFNAMVSRVGHALSVRQRSENQMRQFVSDASHELRTPLSSIRGYAELTRRMAADLPDDAVYALGRIESESVRMTGLVEDLLLLARADEGAHVARTDVELVPLVTDAVNDARASFPNHDWHCEIADAPDGTRALADAAAMHQVLANLLTNAAIHTPSGTRVTLSLRATPDATQIVVADTGPGIPESVQEHLFERFVRADASRTRATGSTGLGLAIAQAIVHSHDGSLTVTSTPGDTQFIVELPTLEPDQEHAPVVG